MAGIAVIRQGQRSTISDDPGQPCRSRDEARPLPRIESSTNYPHTPPTYMRQRLGQTLHDSVTNQSYLGSPFGGFCLFGSSNTAREEKLVSFHVLGYFVYIYYYLPTSRMALHLSIKGESHDILASREASFRSLGWPILHHLGIHHWIFLLIAHSKTQINFWTKGVLVHPLSFSMLVACVTPRILALLVSMHRPIYAGRG